jgi:hypothetical protein
VVDLRAGQEWNPQLLELIREADLFELFWSSNSMRSQAVTPGMEVRAVTGRPNFIRPVYWQQPMPRDDVREPSAGAVEAACTFSSCSFSCDPAVGCQPSLS